MPGSASNSSLVALFRSTIFIDEAVVESFDDDILELLLAFEVEELGLELCANVSDEASTRVNANRYRAADFILMLNPPALRFRNPSGEGARTPPKEVRRMGLGRVRLRVSRQTALADRERLAATSSFGQSCGMTGVCRGVKLCSPSGSNSVVESRLPKPLVAGSIPVSRSN